MGIDSLDLPFLPELDSYLYKTTNNGYPRLTNSMVCSDFACRVLKAGGIFKDLNINCNELTP
jgi:hypothetical protein